MLSLTVTITGDKEEIARFRRLGDKLTNFQLAMQSLGKELKNYYSQDVFRSEGGMYGQRWMRLSPARAAYKRIHYPSKGMLIATGRMQNSFRMYADRNSVTIDNSAPYFKYLQLGSSSHTSASVLSPTKRSPNRYLRISTGGLPPRQMLGISSSVEQMAKRTIEADIKQKLEAA